MDSVLWMFVLLALGIVGWSFWGFSQTLVHELRPGMTKDKIRAQLEELSLRVGLMPRHVPEERATPGHETSIGALSLDHPLIRWVNITKEHSNPGGDSG